MFGTGQTTVVYLLSRVRVKSVMVDLTILRFTAIGPCMFLSLDFLSPAFAKTLGTLITSGVSTFFSSGARLKTHEAPRPEAEGFTEARSAELGRMSHLPQVGVRGGLPRKVFGKLPQNDAFWCILELLMQISKPKIYKTRTAASPSIQFKICTKMDVRWSKGCVISLPRNRAMCNRLQKFLWKNCVSLHVKTSDNKIFTRFFCSNLLLYRKCCTTIQWSEYWSLDMQHCI